MPWVGRQATRGVPVHRDVQGAGHDSESIGASHGN